MDHGSIFQEYDRSAIKSDQINYDWFEKEGEDPTPSEMTFTRPLKNVIPRLALLGFNLERVQREYNAVAQNWLEEQQSHRDDDDERFPDLMNFAEFLAFAATHPLDSLDDTFVSGSDNASETENRGRFAGMLLERFPLYDGNSHVYSERSFFLALVAILHPHSVLRLLAEAKSNEDAPVIWQYGPLVEAGWATIREFVPQARRNETFLIPTEGSSDVHILRHALALLRPGIADFFRFIDVSESHPFSGTGNLVKFAEGLAKIDVQNQIVFVFDNDAEGFDAHQRFSALTLPSNMRGIMLPELEEFRSFPAQGPEGLHSSDINRRADPPMGQIVQALLQAGIERIDIIDIDVERALTLGRMQIDAAVDLDQRDGDSVTPEKSIVVGTKSDLETKPAAVEPDLPVRLRTGDKWRDLPHLLWRLASSPPSRIRAPEPERRIVARSGPTTAHGPSLHLVCRPSNGA